MPAITVHLGNIEGTEAALGHAGGHTLTVDRPPGRAGGMGLGFNGGELLALAIGGCFCNDLRYAAAEMGVTLSRLSVSVTLDLDGNPPIARAAALRVTCETADGGDASRVIDAARSRSTVSLSVEKGFPVTLAG